MRTTLAGYYPNLSMNYDESIIYFLFNHIKSKGMGARGIESIVTDIIKSRVAHWLLLAVEKGYSDNEIREIWLDGCKDDVIVKIRMADDIVIEHVESLKIKRDYFGTSNPEEIAVHAVHEAGHSLAAFLTGGVSPDLITVGTNVGKVNAYVKYSSYQNTISKKEIRAQISQALGGLLAEQLVFGEDDVTQGAESDLMSVFNIVQKSLMESGLGDSLLIRRVSTNFFEDGVPQFNNADRIEIETFIHNIADETRLLLREQKNALIALAQHIFYMGDLNSDEFLEIMENSVNKTKFANYHGLEYKDEYGNALTIKEIAKRIEFSYVHALFGDLHRQASENVLIGRNTALEKNLLMYSESLSSNT
jgi:hypothetical protein